MKNRQTPIPRLVRRLGLTDYDVHADWNESVSRQLAEVSEVRISLRQHIGTPCLPTVRKGETVRVGDLLAVPEEKDGKLQLGAAIHASIDGKVVEITDSECVIRK